MYQIRQLKQEIHNSTTNHMITPIYTLRDAFRDNMDAGDSASEREPGRPRSGGHCAQLGPGPLVAPEKGT